MALTAIIYEETMHLFLNGTEPVCQNCCYYRCVEETGEGGCPIKIVRKYGLSSDEMLPLVKAGRHHLERYGWPYSPENVKRMAQIAAERKRYVKNTPTGTSVDLEVLGYSGPGRVENCSAA